MIGKFVRAIRKSKGYNSSDLAKVLDVTRQQADNCENEISNINVVDFFEICRWLEENPNLFYSYYSATPKEKVQMIRKFNLQG